MLSTDNNIIGAYSTQGYNRYSYALNNPLKYTDPDGEFVFTVLALVIPGAQVFLPIAIGADIGMWNGGAMANGTANPMKWDYSSPKTWAGMAGGAFIGGVSAGLGSTVTAGLGNALTFSHGGLLATAAGGFTAGFIGGGGFSALAGQDPWEGAWKGGVSGFIGGALGGYISGGAGAFAGGATSAGLNTALNGGDGRDVLESMAMGGALSLGAQQLIAASNFRQTGNGLSRKQFNAISRASQKSFTRGREFGGWLTSDGGVSMWGKGEGGLIEVTPRPSNANGEFHTHPNLGRGWSEMHSLPDMNFAVDPSYVIGRRNVWYYNPATRANPIILSGNSIFNPYLFSTFLWR